MVVLTDLIAIKAAVVLIDLIAIKVAVVLIDLIAIKAAVVLIDLIAIKAAVVLIDLIAIKVAVVLIRVHNPWVLTNYYFFIIVMSALSQRLCFRFMALASTDVSRCGLLDIERYMSFCHPWRQGS